MDKLKGKNADGIQVKTFYNYNIPENKNLINAMSMATVLSIIAIIVGFALVMVEWIVTIILIIIGAFLIRTFVPAKKQFEQIFKDDSIVTLDDRLEYYSGTTKVEIPWERIQDIVISDNNILFIKQKKYTITYTVPKAKKTTSSALATKPGADAGMGSISFYSSIQNVDFLLSFIERTRKKRAEELIKVETLKH